VNKILAALQKQMEDYQVTLFCLILHFFFIHLRDFPWLLPEKVCVKTS
jgi:hypothetical protein